MRASEKLRRRMGARLANLRVLEKCEGGNEGLTPIFTDDTDQEQTTATAGSFGCVTHKMRESLRSG